MPGSRMHPALSDRQAFALLSEVQSAQNLMRDTVAAIRRFREPTTQADAVFTLGSIGVEKSAKIMLGCVEVEDHGRWASKKQMMDWGHDIEELVQRLLAAAERSQPQATATDYAASLIAHIRDNTALSLLFATLSRYGRSGRFHYLDVIATDADAKFDAPKEYWERLEKHIADELGGSPYGSPAEFENFLGRISADIAHEIDVWWFAIHRLGVQGCFGELGKHMGWQIWPPGRPDPTKA